MKPLQNDSAILHLKIAAEITVRKALATAKTIIAFLRAVVVVVLPSKLKPYLQPPTTASDPKPLFSRTTSPPPSEGWSTQHLPVKNKELFEGRTINDRVYLVKFSFIEYLEKLLKDASLASQVTFLKDVKDVLPTLRRADSLDDLVSCIRDVSLDSTRKYLLGQLNHRMQEHSATAFLSHANRTLLAEGRLEMMMDFDPQELEYITNFQDIKQEMMHYTAAYFKSLEPTVSSRHINLEEVYRHIRLSEDPASLDRVLEEVATVSDKTILKTRLNELHERLEDNQTQPSAVEDVASLEPQSVQEAEERIREILMDWIDKEISSLSSDTVNENGKRTGNEEDEGFDEPSDTAQLEDLKKQLQQTPHFSFEAFKEDIKNSLTSDEVKESLIRFLNDKRYIHRKFLEQRG